MTLLRLRALLTPLIAFTMVVSLAAALTVKLQQLRGGRYVRHKVNLRSRGLMSIITKPVKVEVRGQSSQLTAFPPIVQQGPTPADPFDDAQVVARFSPPRPGPGIHPAHWMRGRAR